MMPVCRSSKKKKEVAEKNLFEAEKVDPELVKVDTENTFSLKLIEMEKTEEKVEIQKSNVCGNGINSSDLVELLKMLNSGKNVSVDQFEKIVPEYDGVTIPIGKWLENFNENADAYELTEKQKYVNARNKMRGTAKLFLETVSVSNFDSLCEALKEEFDIKFNSADIHQKLMHRQKKNDENFYEYILQMRKLAALGSIEDEVVIRYIVDGIKVRDDLKYPLYSSKTFKELKERFGIIQQMSYKQSSSGAVQKRNYTKLAQYVKDDEGENRAVSRHCFNCGSSTHIRAECKEETKCFKCNGNGHIAKNCEYQKRTVNMLTSDKRSKRMRISNKYISCLIDTGADVSLMQQCVYEKNFGNHSLQKSFAKLYGLGNIAIAAKGSLSLEIEVDNIKTEHTFLVVADHKINNEVIVGYDFIQRFQLEFNAKGYFFSDKTNVQEDVELKCVYNIIEKVPEIDVPPQYRNDVNKLINEYNPVVNPIEHPIQLKIIPKDDFINFNETPTRLSAAERDVVKSQVNEWLKLGIVHESNANIASKVVLAKKKDGSYRVCIDYRKLNAAVLKDRFPVPIIDEVLEKMQSAKFFTVMDLKNGFFHVPIEESSQKYTAFVTREGLFEFAKAPFGFCNSPAVFMRYVNYIFRQMINDGIMELYVDDIVVFGQTADECLKNVKMVLQKAQSFGLEIKWSKCKFLKEKISFLGHEIHNGSVWPGRDKIKAVRNFVVPKNIRGVQAFLGLTGYFRKFVQNYAIIARPLTQLLKKEAEFQIGPSQQQAILNLKSALTQEPVLKIFKQNGKTQLHVDASKYGFGATLVQEHEGKWHPVFYWSRKTSPQEERLHSYFLEVKAAYLATKRLRHYLMGTQFDLVTDCSAFKQTATKKDVPREVVQWLMYLQDFHFNIEHRSGERMKHVDSLSRYPVMVVTSQIQVQIQKAQQNDEHLKAITAILDDKPYADYVMKNGVLYKQWKGQELLVVPRNMEKEIIRNVHNFGHMNSQKTMHAIQQDFFIAHLEKKVKQHISNCVECIVHNRKAGKQEEFLHCIDKGDYPLATIHVDHLGILDSTSKNYKYIFAIVDGFSKFVWLFPTKTTDTQEVIKHLSTWVNIFGNPQRIISDKGAAFLSNLFKEFCNENKIEHIKITTGVPRGNGQIERVNRVILSMLSKLSINDPAKWYQYAAMVQKAINAHVHSSTKFTPYEIMFGVKMKSEMSSDIIRLLQEELLEVFQEDRRTMREECRANIQKAQEAYKRNFDKKRKRSTEYQKGDLVAIKVTQFSNKKLSNKFNGPYRVIEIKRNGRYSVEKAADFMGPKVTSTSVDNMKLWAHFEVDEDLSSETDDEQDDRM
uniref:RNA-directed DNA polymerase n=2 Tax=Endopterygota TaxID=33392 RepID=A0A034VAM6_BACDO